MNKRPSYLKFPNLIVLVGRTNVGKSALFNRIIGEHKALSRARSAFDERPQYPAGRLGKYGSDFRGYGRRRS